MPDWTHTLEARQGGYAAGFLASDMPLEDQDEANGGPNVPAEPATVAAPADKAAPADQTASDVPADDSGASSAKKSGSR